MRYARSPRAILGAEEARGWVREAAAERALLGMQMSPGAAASGQAVRTAQLRQLPPEAIDQVLNTIRGSTDLPKLKYHFERHGAEFGLATPEEYIARFQEHLARDDLRAFTFLRHFRDKTEIFWALIAEDTGATVVYNQTRGRMWSFYRPRVLATRMQNAQMLWVEVRRSGPEWLFEERWEWPN